MLMYKPMLFVIEKRKIFFNKKYVKLWYDSRMGYYMVN